MKIFQERYALYSIGHCYLVNFTLKAIGKTATCIIASIDLSKKQKKKTYQIFVLHKLELGTGSYFHNPNNVMIQSCKKFFSTVQESENK